MALLTHTVCLAHNLCGLQQCISYSFTGKHTDHVYPSPGLLLLLSGSLTLPNQSLQQLQCLWACKVEWTGRVMEEDSPPPPPSLFPLVARQLSRLDLPLAGWFTNQPWQQHLNPLTPVSLESSKGCIDITLKTRFIFLPGLEWQSEPTNQPRSRFVCVKMAKANAKQLPVIMYRQLQEKTQGKPCRFILKKRVSQVQQGEEKETKPVKKAGGEEIGLRGIWTTPVPVPRKRPFFKRTLKTVRSLHPLWNPSKSSPNPTLKETLRKSRLSYDRLIYPTTTQSLQATCSRSCWVSLLSIAKESGLWVSAYYVVITVTYSDDTSDECTGVEFKNPYYIKMWECCIA